MSTTLCHKIILFLLFCSSVNTNVSTNTICGILTIFCTTENVNFVPQNHTFFFATIRGSGEKIPQHNLSCGTQFFSAEMSFSNSLLRQKFSGTRQIFSAETISLGQCRQDMGYSITLRELRESFLRRVMAFPYHEYPPEIITSARRIQLAVSASSSPLMLSISTWSRYALHVQIMCAAQSCYCGNNHNTNCLLRLFAAATAPLCVGRFRALRARKKAAALLQRPLHLDTCRRHPRKNEEYLFYKSDLRHTGEHNASFLPTPI